MDMRKNKDIEAVGYSACHGGEGVLLCKSLLDGFESEQIRFMHADYMAAGVSIGYHVHETNEEVYYLSSGKGILTFDGKEYEMKAGDISVCKTGHGHAFKAVDDCMLIVVGGKRQQ